MSIRSMSEGVLLLPCRLLSLLVRSGMQAASLLRAEGYRFLRNAFQSLQLGRGVVSVQRRELGLLGARLPALHKLALPLLQILVLSRQLSQGFLGTS